MISEWFFLNENYLVNNVVINNPDVIKRNSENGGILVFLHYGSFFITGASIVAQLNCSYTAVSSLQNVHGKERVFWKKFHTIANSFYSSNMFSNVTYPLNMIKWLKSGMFLGVALDVHTKRKNQQLCTFKFKNEEIVLDNYISKLARLSGKPLIPCVIEFDKYSSKHILSFSNEIFDYENAVQMSLDYLSNNTNESSQYFHNIDVLFRP
jgi:lauroyl/myristoyl acyltransferase